MKMGAFMKNKIDAAVIGCGAMGGAVVSCLLNPTTAAVLKASGSVLRVTACDTDEAKLMPFKGRCAVTLSAAQATANCDCVIVALPCAAAPALSQLNLDGKIVISLMAGVTTDALSSLAPRGKIVRAMPNLNATVGESFTAYCATALSESDKRIVELILGSLGAFEEMPERDIEAATGLAGCAPAFVFSAIEAFCAEAEARGFAPELAKRMAVQAFYGSALCAERYDGALDALISDVATPGGATAAGLKVLRDGEFKNTLRGAISAAIARAEEMRND